MELNLEMKRRVRGNHAASTLTAIAERRRNGEFARAADFHADEAEVPSLDDLPGADREAKRRIAVFRRSVENRAVIE